MQPKPGTRNQGSSERNSTCRGSYVEPLREHPTATVCLEQSRTELMPSFACCTRCTVVATVATMTTAAPGNTRSLTLRLKCRLVMNSSLEFRCEKLLPEESEHCWKALSQKKNLSHPVQFHLRAWRVITVIASGFSRTSKYKPGLKKSDTGGRAATGGWPLSLALGIIFLSPEAHCHAGSSVGLPLKQGCWLAEDNDSSPFFKLESATQRCPHL